MQLETYATFVLAAAVLIVIPGPSCLLVVSRAIDRGRRGAAFVIAGEAAAHVLFVAGATAGLSTVLATAAGLAPYIRWAGAAYLVYLGIRQWRAATALEIDSTTVTSGRSLFFQGFAVTATNPKALIFFAAFFTPFVDPAGAVGPQFAILGVTFIIIFLIISALYALAAERSRRLLLEPRRARIRNRVTGALFVAAGIGLACTRNK